MRGMALLGVVVFLSMAAFAYAEERGAAGVGPVRLAGQSPPSGEEPPTASLLTRELFCQAVLIAARDGLGRPTRDQALHEPIDAEGDAAEGLLELALEVRRGENVRHARGDLKVREGDGWKSLWREEIPLAAVGMIRIDYLSVVREAERLSREDFLIALQEAGIEGTANRINPEATLPEEVERRLGEMDYFAQFDAVRRIHARIREEGESPALLGGLVRGYANLSRMAEMHWDASYKVFGARALLYAERMGTVHGASADFHYHRAYARGLSGLQTPALGELGQAERLREEAGGEAPAWAPLLEAFCRYDSGELAELALQGPDLLGLGMFLCFLTVEYSGSSTVIMGMGEVALEANPLSLRVLDGVTEMVGTGYQGAYIERASATLAESMVQRLGEMEEVPAGVEEELRGSSTRGVTALVAAGREDAGEPSWAVLGRMIQESQFVHVERLAYLLAVQFEMEFAELIDAVEPLVTEHRYRPLIESYAAGDADASEHAALLREMRIVDAPYRMRRVWYHLRDLGLEEEPLVELLRQQTLRHIDDTSIDIENALHHRPRLEAETRRLWARRLLQLGPNSPFGVAIAVEVDWENVEGQAEQWEREVGHHPRVSAALARRYLLLERYEDAERALKLHIASAPDRWAYERLAEIHLERGGEAQWLATMEQFLEQEEYGFSHLRARVNIANRLMDRREYERALPYATEAAESWARWAMQAAIECHEGLGDYEQAELWIRRQVENYPESSFDWYLWCQRTGRGDLEAARRHGQKYLALLDDSAESEELLRAAVFHRLEGRPREALEAMKERMHRTTGPLSAMHIALLSIELDDPEPGREALLQLLEASAAGELERPYDGVLVELAELFAPVMEQWPQRRLDLEAVDRLLEEAEEPSRPDVNGFVGRYLVIRGDQERARDYLTACMQVPHRQLHKMEVSRAIAAAELRRLGERD
jgi:tetratricopeptide (TPR) repeat protein